MLQEDPASLRSPPAEGLAETYIDLQMNIKLMENPDEPEDIIPALESVDEATVHILADEAALAAGPGGRVACIASPGVYHSLKEAHPDHKNDLFVDFDPRFRVSLKNNTTSLKKQLPRPMTPKLIFIYFSSKQGENTLIIPLDGDKPLAEHLPSQLQHAFQVVVVDATFLVSCFWRGR